MLNFHKHCAPWCLMNFSYAPGESVSVLCHELKDGQGFIWCLWELIEILCKIHNLSIKKERSREYVYGSHLQNCVLRGQGSDIQQQFPNSLDGDHDSHVGGCQTSGEREREREREREKLLNTNVQYQCAQFSGFSF